MLKIISDHNLFKENFKKKFNKTIEENYAFKIFLYNVFINRGNVYAIGGYLRDIVLGQESRDLDLLINLKHDILEKLLTESNLSYSFNRFNGAKIQLDNFEIDLWSIDNNWAFKNNVVTRNEDNLLENIANGCFYNYDSLVINVLNLALYVKKFNEMVKKNELDILQKRNIYKLKNPTIEGNILRAFYLQKRFNLQFSKNCSKYLIMRLGYLQDKYSYPIAHLLKIIEKYPKYKSVLSEDVLINLCEKLDKTDNGTLNLFDL